MGITTDNQGNTVVNNPDGPPIPRVLSKTAFQDHAVSQLGAGTIGMARFQAIMDACQAGAGAVKFCFSRYEGANTFEKAKVADFTALMVANALMTANERTAIINNWPVN